MGRRKEAEIRVNDTKSLESLIRETYNDACGQITEAQRVINEMTVASQPQDVRDHVDVASQKTNALKIKDSAIKIKLEIAKLQNEILKNNGDTAKAVQSTGGAASVEDMAAVRAMINQAKTERIEEGYKLI